MPTINWDLWQDLTGVEDRGAWRSLRRKVRLEYSAAEMEGPPKLGGPRILYKTMQSLDDAGLFVLSTLDSRDGNNYDIPALPTTLPTGASIFGNPDNPFSHLVLVKRTPTIVAPNNWVDVVLDYEHILDGYNQILVNPPSGRLFVKGRSSIIDKDTNFYYKDGVKANGRRLLSVAHTYPEWDMGTPNAPFDPDLPRTVVQTGSINIPFPAQNFTIQALHFTNNIWQDANNMVGWINEDVILGQPPYTYICSEFAWELNNAFVTPFQRGNYACYKVSVEFQFNFDTWDATVVFNDQRLSGGRPPHNVLAAAETDDQGVLRLGINPLNGAFQPAGYWQVPSLQRKNFRQFLNAQFEIVGPSTPIP